MSIDSNECEMIGSIRATGTGIIASMTLLIAWFGITARQHKNKVISETCLFVPLSMYSILIAYQLRYIPYLRDTMAYYIVMALVFIIILSTRLHKWKS